MLKKKKVTTEVDWALEDMIQAQKNYNRALQNFNNADFEFFDIANKELTIAQLQLDVSVTKLRQLCQVTGMVPYRSPIKVTYYPE